MSYLQSKIDPSLFVEGGELEPWRKALMDAAEIIRTRGWCQGAMTDRSGAVCALGSLLAAEAADSAHAWTRFHRYIGTDPIMWNDAFERTREDVIRALESCALSRARDALARS